MEQAAPPGMQHHLLLAGEDMEAQQHVEVQTLSMREEQAERFHDAPLPWREARHVQVDVGRECIVQHSQATAVVQHSQVTAVQITAEGIQPGRYGLDPSRLAGLLSPLTAHSLLRQPCVDREAASALLSEGAPVLRPPRPLLAPADGPLVVAWTDGARERERGGGGGPGGLPSRTYGAAAPHLHLWRSPGGDV